jgi:hypothetical protein
VLDLTSDEECNCIYTCLGLDKLLYKVKASNNSSCLSIMQKCAKLHKCQIVDVLEEDKIKYGSKSNNSGH